jgi:hypothetical protein
MIRRWTVWPDMQIETQRYGPVPYVSRQLIDQAFLDGAAMVAVAGGGFTAFPHRHPTDRDHEMVTTQLMCEWKDRTDAKPQPEPAVELPPQPQENPEVEGLANLAESPEIHEIDPEQGVPAVGAEDSPDGFDYSQLEEEDLDSVPENV